MPISNIRIKFLRYYKAQSSKIQLNLRFGSFLANFEALPESQKLCCWKKIRISKINETIYKK